MVEINQTLTRVPGFLVGNAQDVEALTGCTVILCKRGAVGGVDQRGGAPGTRETDLLHPMHLVEKVHAIVLAGGSAFGLDASTGVMQYLEEHKIGFNSGYARVPIVSSAILYDLGLGDAKHRPDAAMGYSACKNASRLPVPQGNFGAGTGASIGKILGMACAMKSGIGSACINLGGGVFVGALIAVNAFGDVIDPNNGEIIAGARKIIKSTNQAVDTFDYLDTLKSMKSLIGKTVLGIASHQNTVIGVVATNAKLTKEETNKVAQMAHDGLAMTIRPAHTMLDGDTIFAMSAGNLPANVNLIGAYAAQAVAQAILSAVRLAKSAGGLPGLGS
jgi:L-aminopeptidase/D-esterase-like protein